MPKISELTEDTNPSTDDYVPTVDNATSATKKVTIGNLTGSKVAKAGDSMTGALTIDSAGAIATALHTGPAAGTTNAAVGGIGVELVGSNNTAGGMNLIFCNPSNGTSAFTSFFIQNDLADSSGTHYSNIGMNSSTYNDPTFGTAIAVPNQFGITTTDGPITLAAFHATAGAITFVVGGSATTNEVGRIDTNGLRVGFPTSRLGKLLLSGSTSGSTTIQCSTTASGTWTFGAATDTVVGKATTDTLTNKRINKRSPTITQSATPVINTDSTDVAHITGLAQDITSMTSSLTGTPAQGNELRIDFTDNGSARAITWGAKFEASTVALPTTTVVNTRLDVTFYWNTVTSKWRCVQVA